MDNGDNWTQLSLPIVVGISLSINSSDHIFAGSFDSGIFRSTDNGNNWLSIGLTDHNVSSLDINSIGHIFAGTYDGGVFRSTDSGENWTPINAGLTNPGVSALAASPNGHIFAGTTGGGVYRSVRSTTSVKENKNEMPFSFELCQNYPNPFNPITIINYEIPIQSNVILKIYDLLGNEVVTLVDEIKNAGRYEIRFDASILSSGVYLYNLEAGNHSAMKKLILIK